MSSSEGNAVSYYAALSACATTTKPTKQKAEAPSPPSHPQQQQQQPAGAKVDATTPDVATTTTTTTPTTTTTTNTTAPTPVVGEAPAVVVEEETETKVKGGKGNEKEKETDGGTGSGSGDGDVAVTAASPCACACPATSTPGDAAPRKKFTLKTPKGTRDFGPLAMSIRQKVISRASAIYERHGAVGLETPTFELSEILKGKYGEEGQDLIYNLQRGQTSENLSLRYDLTVPFARFIAQNGVRQMKRYQIGRVYRRDHVNEKQGRYREFYQCDYDCAGPSENMVADAECVAIISELLQTLELAPFLIKVNNRQLLDLYLRHCGVTPNNIRTVCSSIDKLDKQPWKDIRNEIINTKHAATPETADQLEKFIAVKGTPATVLAAAQELLRDNAEAMAVLADMKLLFEYVEAFGAIDSVVFDLSLARGLDYYTGVIYEATLCGKEIGSICGGGRYDGLVGMFSGEKVPSVGFSLGIERVFNILETRAGNKIMTTNADVLVLSIGAPYTLERMKICKMLWDAQIKAEMPYQQGKIRGQVEAAAKAGIFALVFLGEDEIAKKSVTVKILKKRSSTLVELDKLCEFLIAENPPGYNPIKPEKVVEEPAVAPPPAREARAPKNREPKPPKEPRAPRGRGAPPKVSPPATTTTTTTTSSTTTTPTPDSTAITPQQAPSTALAEATPPATEPTTNNP
ncbi:histidine--tRNA ligase, cytoplasmic [Pelomyxa schiedti]|nr:histidine--tRNA ligase, cytoplasmic [Pelomyxa schiedti]